MKFSVKKRYHKGAWIIFSVALSLFSFGKCVAQNALEFTSISGVKVSSPGNYSLGGKSYGVEVAYNMSQTKRFDEWIKRLNVRDIVIVGGYRNMNNVYVKDSTDSKGFLGSIYTLSARLNVKLISFKKTEILLIGSTGLVYSSSSYFTDGNPIIGSRLNFLPQGGIKIRTPLSGSTSLVAGAETFHYSNIGFQVPNSGVNAIQVSLGIIKDLKNAVKETPIRNVDKVRGFIDIEADIGRRGSNKSYTGSWKSGLYAGYNYKLNQAVSVKAGMDAVYYYTAYDNTNETFQHLATSYDPWRLGVSLGGDLWLGRFIIMGNVGYYLKFNSVYPVKIYEVAGFKYYANSWLGVQLKMYFNKAQADYFGAGLVFRVPTQKFK